MQNIKKLALIILTVSATGCSYFHNSNVIQNRETDYLKATSVPPLDIPPGMNSNKITQHYPVSYRHYTNATKPINLTPPGLNTDTK